MKDIKLKYKPMEKRIQNQSDNYYIRDMNEWNNVNAKFILTDCPFGIKFTGKKGNYNRKKELVVDGYIEWSIEEYGERIEELLTVIERNLVRNGQALILSGWNNSNIIHDKILSSNLILQGKLYWSYNFAVYSRKRPAHNIYEIFWVTKSNEWFYQNKCSTIHCSKGEANLSTLAFKRDYKVGLPKYPNRLAYNLIQCILEHFTEENDLVFDCLAGSGMLGVVCYALNRKFLLGDLNNNGKRVFQELLAHYIPKIDQTTLPFIFRKK